MSRSEQQLILAFREDEDLICELLNIVRSTTLSHSAKVAEVSRMLRPFGLDIAPIECEQTTWTATEIATELGVTAARVGRVANALNLKTTQYGEYRLSKSRYGPKQVETFYYFSVGREAIHKEIKRTKINDNNQSGRKKSNKSG